VAWAQAKVGSGVITAETQFYLKRLEVKDQNVTTRGSKVRLREASLFVVCKPEADVNAVKAVSPLPAYRMEPPSVSIPQKAFPWRTQPCRMAASAFRPQPLASMPYR